MLRRKQKIMMFIMSFVLLLMGIGYATFSTLLNISGTGYIKRNWNVYIESMLVTSVNGNANGTSKVSGDRLSASYVSNLYTVGDYVEYTVHVVNKGTLNAELSNILLTEEQTSEYIKHEILNVNMENEHPVLEPNESIDILIRTTYVLDQNGNAYFGEEELISTAMFRLTFIQHIENQEANQQENSDVPSESIPSGTTMGNGNISATVDDNITWTYSDTGVLRISGSGDMKEFDSDPFDEYDISQMNISELPLVHQIIINYLRSKGINDNELNNIYHQYSYGSFIKILYDMICSQTYFDNKHPDFIDWDTYLSGKVSSNEITLEQKGLLLTYAEEIPRITSIIINDGVGNIGYNAFNELGYSGSITIPSSVTNISPFAFANNGITSVTIPNSVISIGFAAFTNNELESVTIPNGVTSIGVETFYQNKLTSVTIPSSVTSIGFGAFENNKLERVTIPNSVTSIENRAFANNKLISIMIPGSVKNIGPSAFSYNSLLTNVTISEGVEIIGNYAFTHSGITSVTIPSSVTSIGVEAFSNNKLTNATIKGTPTVATDAFRYNPGLTRANVDTTLDTSSWLFN